LRIIDEDSNGDKNVYTYATKRVAKFSYTLVYDAEKRAFTLERVEDELVCNLTATPWQSDSAALKEQYPQIRTAKGADESLDGDEGASMLGQGQHQLEDDIFAESEDQWSSDEENNPFDYRNFLKESASPAPSPAGGSGRHTVFSPIPRADSDLVRESAKTPSHLPSFRDDADDESSQVRARAARRSESPDARVRSNAKARPRDARPPARKRKPPMTKAKPSAEDDDDLTIEFDPLPARSAPVSPQRAADADKRAASPAPSSVDGEEDEDGLSDGGLIIEMEPETKPKRGLGGELGRLASGGPVSLRSVANSLSPPVGHDDFAGDVEQPEVPLTQTDDRYEDVSEADGADEEEEGEEDEEEEVQSNESDADADEAVEPPSMAAELDADAEAEPGADADVDADEDGASELEAELAQALESEPLDDGDQEGVPLQRIIPVEPLLEGVPLAEIHLDAKQVESESEEE
jgi:hypothetical protein